jgi:hypothetical protein
MDHRRQDPSEKEIFREANGTKKNNDLTTAIIRLNQ